VKHPNATGTFGDFELQKKIGEFGLIDRKLQGLEGEFNYGGSDAYFSVASSRGKFNTNQFNGQDGVQGPYGLSGRNNEPNMIIIAGTEKVYLDGIEMKRGENNDYTIEYSIDQITFTTKRLITVASRIPLILNIPIDSLQEIFSVLVSILPSLIIEYPLKSSIVGKGMIRIRPSMLLSPTMIKKY
jgi:hypothetical protein